MRRAAWLPMEVVVPFCALELPEPGWLVDVGVGVGVGVVVEELFV